ncbi:DNA repair exonuclease [Desulfuromonas sp. AOP6]|uniref:metallophosphoesterase family protein n=1 Tax=Desulfuromonas sp. AOP6 TaxID=1566351 RepID=UPI0012769911|nr:DNA repair exonuclease [Desulfuromonas sp. AOP6]BCA79831.1 nuclease SbcCD subunit D [Desulfuromonas sp. AOP6]
MDLKFLHTADIHLDASFSSLGTKESIRRKDLLDCFDRLINLAIKNEVHLFVVAGDLFDHPRPSASTVGKVQAGLQRLSDRGIIPVLLPGTHDHIVAPDNIYHRTNFPGAVLLDAPQVESPTTITIAGVDVHLYGFAYHPRHSSEALKGMKRHQLNGVHLGLLHGSLKGSPEWDHRPKDLPFTLEDIKGWGLDYVALGHYHNFSVLRDGDKVLACYPGTPEGRRFGENGSRHCALVSVKSDGVSVEKLSVNQRVLKEETLDITGMDNEDEIAEAARRLADPNLILRLTLTGVLERPFEIDQLRERCENDFFNLELRDETDLFESALVREIGEEDTVRGLFVRRVRQLLEKVAPEETPILEEALREVLVRFSRER